MIKTIVFLISWIGMFILSILGIAYITVPNIFLTVTMDTLVSKVIFFNICLFYFIASILKLLSKFEKDNNYTIKNEHGTISISNNTVKEVVKDILAKDNDVKGIKIDTGIKSNKYFVKIELEILSEINITEKIKELQTLISNQLSDKLQVQVSNVEIKIAKVTQNKEVV